MFAEDRPIDTKREAFAKEKRRECTCRVARQRWQV